LTTLRVAVSVVLNRRPHSGHCRRRRIESPSSLVRESTTRESGYLQNGQNMVGQAYGMRRRVPGQLRRKRAVTAAPCAGRSSAVANATIFDSASRNAARVYRTTCCGRRNV
jgi:hypothetical protein